MGATSSASRECLSSELPKPVRLSSADAIPDPIDVPAVVHRTVATDTDTAGHRVERSCFITPARWNDSLDGPLPRCYT